MVKLLSVFGATGRQGGALINHIPSSPSLSAAFALRGITRDASKPASITLPQRGVEIVEGIVDLNDTSSLHKAVAGSHVVFGVTNFWDKGSYDIEVAQGKAIADAAVAAGAARVFWYWER
ncbi:hypothetical protein FQN53_006922 [Emmonsiellopsis sp. PD_33]|nr:hypothetical protein FQN53_006922 [Emmonsiellopsis sp. PD_33]